jgi:hypothetical protein
LPRRPESYIARTIIDLASLFEEAELYDLIRNEFLAVDIVFPVIETDDDQGQSPRWANNALSPACRTRSIGNQRMVVDTHRTTGERPNTVTPENR